MKNKIVLLLFSFICVALCSQSIMAQLNDNVCDPATVMDATIPNPPPQASVCTDNSDNMLTFTAPTSTLPNVDFIITVNDIIADINADGSFSADTLADGDIVCVTSLSYDLAAIQGILTTVDQLCSNPITAPIVEGQLPGACAVVQALVAAGGINSLEEALDFAATFGTPITTIAEASTTLDGVNAQVGTILGNICYATTEPVCYDVVVCNPCPTLTDIVVTDSEVCSGGSFDVCFQFDADVAETLTATANGIEVDGTGGGTEICVPVTADNQTCDLAPLDVTVGLQCEWVDVDVSGFIFLPLQVYPDPANFTIAVTPSAGCGEAPVIVDSTCPTVLEGWALGAPPAAGCATDADPLNDPENGDYIWTQDYSAYGWFANPFAVNCVYPFDSDSENVTGCEDATLCSVPGCTDPAACNYDVAATVDDGSCDFGIAGCPAPCTDIAGCTDPTAVNYDATATCDDGSCMFDVPGCTDPAACNYDVAATVDDGSCDFGIAGCPAPCTDIAGCTDPAAANYDAAATCDDGSCTFDIPGCTDPCAPNYDATANVDDGSCEPYDMTCNTDCTLGDLEEWDVSSCGCVVTVVTVLGCTDPVADNYDANANCDDGSCVVNCADGSIAGTVTVDDDCDGAGGDVPTTPLTVELYDAAGNLITSVTTDASGNYLFDPVPCGTYDVLVVEADLPPCSQGANPNPRTGIIVGDGEAVIAEDFDFQPINLVCNGQQDWEDQEACSVSGGVDIVFPIVACNVTPEVANPDGTFTVVGFDIYNPDAATGNLITTLFEAPSFGATACVPEFTFSGFPENQTCDPQVYEFEIVTTIFLVNADGSLADAVVDPDCGTEVFTATIYPSLTAVDASALNCSDRQIDLVAEDGTVCDSQTQACVDDGDVFSVDFTGTAYDYGQGCSVLTASSAACANCGDCVVPTFVECVSIARACESNSIYVIAPGADTSVDFPTPLAPVADWIFEWYLDGVLVGTNVGHPYFSPSSTGNYTVVVTDPAGCQYWDSSAPCAGFDVSEIIDCSGCN